MSLTARKQPWLDNCMLSARALRHPEYSTGQLATTRGVPVPRIRYSYNPAAAPRFRRVVRRIGPDGQIVYDFVQDQQGVFNADGTYAKSQVALPPLHFNISATENANDDLVTGSPTKNVQMMDNQEKMLSVPMDSPLVMESQRSTERVRAVQALIGDRIADTHGKAPPKLAPFYQSANNYEAEDMTPIALPV